MKRLLPALIATALVAAPSQRASAAEACVRCDNPFAIYRCQVDRPGLPANASIALICITELAKRNGHATCGVSRDTGATCGGEIVTVSPPPDAPIPQAPPPSQATAERPQEPGPDELSPPGKEPVDAEDTVKSKPEDATPETVEDLAKKTATASKKGLENAGSAVVDAAKKTGETIEKTGDAVGTAAKKTWRCLSSFFDDC